MNMFDNLENSVEIYNTFTVGWSRDKVGFGQFSFYSQNGKIYCSNEGMSREFVKQVLCDIVDQSELTD